MHLRRMNPMPAAAGFSLVELSIVLVILGLLVGGILSGQALIRAAELRAVSAEYARYRAAVNTFRDKYFAIPGDMTNAVKFWGAQAGGTTDGVDAACHALNETSPATGTVTCNGNGNGQIDLPPERHRFWQQLANAGLVEGTYTGVQAVSGWTTSSQPKLNSPASRLGNAGWAVFNAPVQDGTGYMYAGTYGNVFTLGFNSVAYETIMAAIKPEEAWNIDMKMDDGRPGTGVVRPRNPNNGSSGQALCATSTDPAVATYNLIHTSIACALYLNVGL